MPFLAKEHVAIPNKDILSWIHDEPTIDQDTPVCCPKLTFTQSNSS
jgi:4-coumarate--CoA ligase